MSTDPTQPYRRSAPGTGHQETDRQEDGVDDQTTTSTTTSTSPLEAGTDVVLDGLAAGRHPVNTAHLVMGVAFLGLVVVWALVTGDVVDGGDTRWLLPVPWLVAGAAGIAATLLAARRSRRA